MTVVRGRTVPVRRVAGRVAASLRPPAGDPLGQAGLGADLRTRSARGAVSTVGGQAARFVLQTGSTVVLARLVSPTEYGLVAMVLALIGVGDALMNLGLSQATVQRRDVTGEQVSFFFWLQTAVGAVLTAVTMLLAGPIAHFYGQPQLVPLTMVLGSVFLLNGLSAQHQAVLTRQMRFGLLSALDVAGLALGIAVAIGMALLGAGVWALVAMSLAVPVTRVVVSWVTSGWHPGPPRRAAGVWPMVRFGLNLTLANVLDYTSQNIDNVLLGRFYGAGVLGLYSRAYNLLLLPIRQVTAPVSRVAVPVLSFLIHQPDRYRRFFTTALSGVAYVSLPGICLLAALSDEIVRVMLGARWAAAAPIFQVLAIGGLMASLRSTNGWLFVSSGHTGRQAVWALVNRPVAIAGIIAGLPWGATGVAWGFVGAHLVLLVPSFVFATKGTSVRLPDIAGAVWRPAAVAAYVYAVAALTHRYLHAPAWQVLLAGILAAVVAVGALLAVWPSVRRDLRQIYGSVFRRQAEPKPPATADLEVGGAGT